MIFRVETDKKVYTYKNNINIDERPRSMEVEKDKIVEKIKRIEGFEYVTFIILYGSSAEGRMTEGSDVDICIGFDGPKDDADRFRLEVLKELFDDRYDIKIFEHLPLYIKKEVLKGEVFYSRDREELYDTAYRVIKEFDDFKTHYYDYIGKEAIS